MVHQLVPPADIEKVTYELARQIAENAPLSLAGMKQAITRMISLREQVPHEDIDALALHFVGSPFSSLAPPADRPRKPVQSAASAEEAISSKLPQAKTTSRRMDQFLKERNVRQPPPGIRRRPA